MVTAFLLPLSTTATANVADRFITWQGLAVRIAMLFDFRIVPGRNHRLNVSLIQGVIHFPLVVAAIAVKRLYRLVNLIEQLLGLIRIMSAVFRQQLGLDHLGFGIHREVNFTPRASLALAMRPRFPLAFAKHLQARAVDNQVDRPALVRHAERNVEFRGPLGQRTVVGNSNIHSQQLDQRPPKPFRLSIRKLEQLADRQEAFDGRVAVHKRPTYFRAIVRMLPTFQRILTKPNRDFAAAEDRLVILSPICNSVRSFLRASQFRISVMRRGVSIPRLIYG